MKKQYNIKISKFFDKESDSTVVEISVSKELSDLLKKFACIEDNERRTTNWSRTATREDETSDSYIERYLVKSVVKNSLRWSSIFDLLFTDDIINNQKIKVPLLSVRMFIDVQDTISEIKELVSVMEKISTNKDIDVTLKVN
jgi:hypothetical protein